jgi:glycosyltransferase involved in cell wall biosynthesis
MPSLCYEVFPLVVLEAFREGTPIIARDRGPYPEIVAESQAGLLFETHQELRAALSRLATDDELRNTLSRHALAAYQRNWTETAGVERYLQLIRRTAERRGRGDLAQAIDDVGAALPGPTTSSRWN